MKSLLLLFCVCLLSITAFAQPPVGNANAGDVYGAKTSVKKAMTMSEATAKLDGQEAMKVKVITTVKDVCANKGCWIKVAVDDSTTAMVKMKDYAFFLPTAVKGKTVVLDGELQRVITPIDELKHYAKDAKKSQAEIDAITEPKEELSFVAKGIRVVQ